MRPIALAAVDGVVRAVLVDPGAEVGRAELEGHGFPPAYEMQLAFIACPMRPASLGRPANRFVNPRSEGALTSPHFIFGWGQSKMDVSALMGLGRCVEPVRPMR